MPSPLAATAVTIGGRQSSFGPMASMLRSSCTVLCEPARSALFTTNTSAISMMPALIICTPSPSPGVSTTTVVSAIAATSSSDWPTPTVSRTTRSKPAAPRSLTASRLATDSPPRWPRAPIERMNTPGSRAWRCILMRSPRIAPPE